MNIFAAIPILTFAVAFQVTLMPYLAFNGGTPDLVFLLTLSWGFGVKLEQGLVWAFIGGIAKDMLSAAPLGTSSVGLIITLFLLDVIRRQFSQVNLLMLFSLALVGSVVQQASTLAILYFTNFRPAYLGEVGYGALREALTYTILPSIIYNLVAILPIYALIRLLQRRILPQRAL